MIQRHAGECRQLLMLQLESKTAGIKGDGSAHVADLVPNAVKALHELLCRLLCTRVVDRRGRFSSVRHHVSSVARKAKHTPSRQRAQPVVSSNRHREHNMKRPDWHSETLSRMRRLIKEADPEIVEELKWVKPSNPGGI